MRINKLKIKNYKNINAEMEHHNGIIGFIGNNGSGKSNLLEALSYLFRSLYTPSYKIDFEYDLIYTTSAGARVQFVKRGTKVLSFLNDEPIIDYSDYLPKKVIAIYSGEEGRMFDDCYFPYYDDFISKLHSSSSEYSELPKMLYLNKFYWQISLLALLLSDAPDNVAFVEKVLKIDKVDKIKFDFAKGNYEKYKSNLALSFIKSIDDKSEYKLDELKKKIDLLYSTDDVYKYLYLAFTPKSIKILKDIIILFNDSLTLKELSEGQKKLLLIKAALEFAGQEDTLFIMDEPDAHIHINNKEQITNSFIPYKHNRQIVLTTHSPTVTRCLEDDELYMISYGKIEPKNRQEIMEDITGSFWNKHQQSSFLASKKPVILLVEGVHDRAHIENAYSKLQAEYRELNFDIFSFGGESKIAPFMRGLYEGKLTDGKIYVAIYDNDTAGNNALTKEGFLPIENEIYRRLKDDTGNSYFAFCYPKPNGISHECTVENLFPLGKYQEAYKQAFDDEDGFTNNSKSVSKISDNITDNAKRNLSLKSKEFDITDFVNFKQIFDLICRICAINKTVAELRIIQGGGPKAQGITAVNNYIEIYCKLRNADVIAHYFSENNIMIKSGSVIATENVPSLLDSEKEYRARLTKSHCKFENEKWIVTKDIPFTSPSGAIKFAVGSNINGWKHWKIRSNDKELKTIRPQ